MSTANETALASKAQFWITRLVCNSIVNFGNHGFGSFNNLTLSCCHNEDILLRHWLRFTIEVDCTSLEVRSHGAATVAATTRKCCRYNWIPLYLMDLFTLCGRGSGCSNGKLINFNCYLPLPQVLVWTLSCNCDRKVVATAALCERTFNSLLYLASNTAHLIIFVLVCFLVHADDSFLSACSPVTEDDAKLHS